VLELKVKLFIGAKKMAQRKWRKCAQKMLVKLTQGYFISMNDYRKSHTIVLFAVFFDKEYKKNSNSHMPSYVQLNPQAVFYTAF
jgi:hypothetical protein